MSHSVVLIYPPLLTIVCYRCSLRVWPYLVLFYVSWKLYISSWWLFGIFNTSPVEDQLAIPQVFQSEKLIYTVYPLWVAPYLYASFNFQLPSCTLWKLFLKRPEGLMRFYISSNTLSVSIINIWRGVLHKYAKRIICDGAVKLLVRIIAGQKKIIVLNLKWILNNQIWHSKHEFWVSMSLKYAKQRSQMKESSMKIGVGYIQKQKVRD